MNIPRLHTLASFLRTVPEDKFDLDHWVSVDGRNFNTNTGATEGEEINGAVIKATCGMAACAVGWCGSIKEFRDAGLEIRVARHYSEAGIASPFYDGKRDWEAVKSFFDVDDKVADHLFQTCTYQPPEGCEEWDADGKVEHKPTPGEVADRIDELTGRVSAPSRNLLLALT